MRIESVDLFYFALPQIADQADGSQDTFVVRVRSDSGLEGFGESDSSPLVAVACYCLPMSHSNIQPLDRLLVGQTLEGVEDIHRIYANARRRALDVAHFPHAYAAADIALWDLLGKARRTPAWRLLGYERSIARKAYASYVFPDTPEQTRELARRARAEGFTAAKFGWGPMGHKGRDFDVALVAAARAGLGDDAALMVDAGQVWGTDVATVLDRAAAFAPYKPTWLEEPVSGEAVEEYGQLAGRSAVPIAGGEACDTIRMARDYLNIGKVNFLQIDAGRIGGITPAYTSLELARTAGATWVNHTFKSHISLAAAMTVMAGEPTCPWVEYCQAPSPLVRDIVRNPILPDAQGQVRLNDGYGLGIDVDLAAVSAYAKPIVIRVGGEQIGGTAAI